MKKRKKKATRISVKMRMTPEEEYERHDRHDEDSIDVSEQSLFDSTHKLVEGIFSSLSSNIKANISDPEQIERRKAERKKEKDKTSTDADADADETQTAEPETKPVDDTDDTEETETDTAQDDMDAQLDDQETATPSAADVETVPTGEAGQSQTAQKNPSVPEDEKGPKNMSISTADSFDSSLLNMDTLSERVNKTFTDFLREKNIELGLQGMLGEPVLTNPKKKKQEESAMLMMMPMMYKMQNESRRVLDESINKEDS
jgi:hypothetical protein